MTGIFGGAESVTLGGAERAVFSTGKRVFDGSWSRAVGVTGAELGSGTVLAMTGYALGSAALLVIGRQLAPIRMVEVCCATAASQTSGAEETENWSRKWCSTTKTWLKPACSATFTCSSASQKQFATDVSVHGRGTSIS